MVLAYSCVACTAAITVFSASSSRVLDRCPSGSGSGAACPLPLLPFGLLPLPLLVVRGCCDTAACTVAAGETAATGATCTANVPSGCSPGTNPTRLTCHSIPLRLLP